MTGGSVRAAPRSVPTTVVIPTVGRHSLVTVLDALAAQDIPSAGTIIVDDRPDPTDETTPSVLDAPPPGITRARSHGRGPAAARNLGWRLARTPWVSFLDDDVVPDPDWTRRLATDLEQCTDRVAATQGIVHVPLPADRRPTDWERSTSGLAETWCNATDLTCRREALSDVGGFDERFRRAHREDVDLGLRLRNSGWRLIRGTRQVRHPVRRADRWVSVAVQAGNSDDMLMWRLHGPLWHRRADAPRGRRRRHVATASAAATAVVARATGRRGAARVAAAAWALGTIELATARIMPGPKTADEVATMLATSMVIPFAATWHTARGLWRHRKAGMWRGLPDVVLFDRDGTLIHDIPYNGDPERVHPIRGAMTALTRLRDRGIRVGVVTNHSGVARGLLTEGDVAAVHHRIDELLGPFSVWKFCPHGPDEVCQCRKPAPGMVKDACDEVGVDPARCLVVGDTGADVVAATAAGASAILVPNLTTRPEEITAAPRCADDITQAVDLVLGGDW